jgi:(E)-4-hydroxy-3-methylbut-2-enyl-diphosphate synthase
MNIINYNRRKTQAVKVGGVYIGSEFPVCVQTMANTDTNDVQSSVNQAKRVVKAGGEILRYTTQGILQVENLAKIRSELRRQNIDIPLVADVHFNPKVALAAANVVEKVRINPGNFVASKSSGIYSDNEYFAEIQDIKKRILPLIEICRKNGTAIRIGVNHGSLSPRIMSKFGDTPEGLAMSCIEFLEILQQENFTNAVISVKASNALVMIFAVRLLAKKMREKNMLFPLHLGVTEAGSGEDGRIKSAVGIGVLLAEGLGDTIRVSLSEEPEAEIPIAKKLSNYISQRIEHQQIIADIAPNFNYFEYHRRQSFSAGKIGGKNPVAVIAAENGDFGDLQPDIIFPDCCQNNSYNFIEISYNDLSEKTVDFLLKNPEKTVILTSNHQNPTGEMNAFFQKLLLKNIINPVIIRRKYFEENLEDLQIKAAVDFSSLIINGFGDGIFLENEGKNISKEQINSVAFAVLQAARTRISRNDYIACPSCGRTMFDLQTTLEKVKAATVHLKNLKIAVMGCIVNGPGEMADADYGYIGAGKGKISLYRGKTCIERNIPEKQAVTKLLEIINRENIF